MAKQVIKLETKETAEKKDGGGKTKVIDLTQKSVADNLDAVKKQEKELEKQEARLENIENTVKAAEEETQKMIAEKKAELVTSEPVVEKKETKIIELSKPAKKKGKWDINPLNWARHIGTRALSGIVGFPSRFAAKLHHIAARPQQLISGKFYKDLGKNIIKTPGAILTTLSGALYRPHRDKVKFEDNYKDYGPEFANPTDKSKIVRFGKKALWFGGKVAVPTLTAGVWSVFPKFFSNLSRGMNHAIHETFEGIRDSKWHWNPRKWNLRTWKYSKTREAFRKAFSWNAKGIAATGAKKETKVIDMTVETEEKKAA